MKILNNDELLAHLNHSIELLRLAKKEILDLEDELSVCNNTKYINFQSLPQYNTVYKGIDDFLNEIANG